MECARKYRCILCDDVTNAKVVFSIFWYRVSAPNQGFRDEVHKVMVGIKVFNQNDVYNLFGKI